MNGDISLVMYHGGRFVRNGRGNREYTWKERRVWDVDPDLVLIFDLKNMVVECGNYGNVEGMQWMRKEFHVDYDLGLRHCLLIVTLSTWLTLQSEMENVLTYTLHIMLWIV
jgi:hypothetical protein